MRIASYAKMRIAAPALRKKFAAEQCSSSGVRIFADGAELFFPGDPVKGDQEAHQEIAPTRPSNLFGRKGEHKNQRQAPDADRNTPPDDFHLGKRAFQRV
jgi:hypothetical protein